MNYLNIHNYFKNGIFVLDCKSMCHTQKQWKFNDIIYSKLIEFGIDFSEIAAKGTKIQYVWPKVTNTLSPLPTTLLKTVSTSSYAATTPNTPSTRRIIHVLSKLNICIILFNVDDWNNDEIYLWLDTFNRWSHDKAKCIFTMKKVYPLITHPMYIQQQ